MLCSELALGWREEEADSECSSLCASPGHCHLREQTHSSLPVWDTPLLAAEAQEKLPGGFYSSGGHRHHLTVLSPEHKVAEELPEMLEDQSNTTGFGFYLILSHCSCTMLQNPVPDITCRALGRARTKIFTTSGKPADIPALDFSDKG